jgi:hypothetical protein
MEMELLKRETMQVREETYIINHPKEGILIYKEWLDSTGKVVDSQLRSKSGYSFEDSIIQQEVWDFVDQLEGIK